MAKRAKRAAAPSNGLDVEVMDGFVERIEDLDAEGRKMHAEYMAERKGLNDDKREVYKRAKDAGIPPEVLRITIETRALDRRADALPDRLNGENRFLFDDFMARWDSIRNGKGDPGPGVLVKAPAAEPVQPIGRPEETEAREPEKEDA